MSRSEAASTCTGCGRGWTAHGEAHCAVCHRHFTTYRAFDLHLALSRDGEQVTHRDPAMMLDRYDQPRLVLVERSSGPTWTGAMAAERPAHWRAAS